jgi:hypothetical protein
MVCTTQVADRSSSRTVIDDMEGRAVECTPQLVKKWERGPRNITVEIINPFAKPPQTNLYIAVMDALSELAVYGKQISSSSRHSSHVLVGFLLDIAEKVTPQLIQSLKDDDPGVRSAVIDALYGVTKYST